MIYRADLHIHSVLSPCGSLEMAPDEIVEAALKKKLDIIAISDHNCTKNLRTFRDVAAGKIEILFGVEVQSVSETHILALFDEIHHAEAFGDFIYGHLPEIPNDPEYFGDQVIVNADNSIAGFEDRLLIQSVDLEIEDIISTIHDNDGLAFFAHIDRDTFSVISQLGFIPRETMADGAEISSALTIARARERYPEYGHMPFITNSDAHYLEDVGKSFTEFQMENVSVAEIRMALKQSNGRRIVYDG